MQFFFYFHFPWDYRESSGFLENRVLLKPVLGGYAALQATILSYEESQLNPDFDFRSFEHSLFQGQHLWNVFVYMTGLFTLDNQNPDSLRRTCAIVVSSTLS